MQQSPDDASEIPCQAHIHGMAVIVIHGDVAVLLDYSIAEGDCTDQDAYEPDLEDIKIDAYTVVVGQVQEVELP